MKNSIIKISMAMGYFYSRQSWLFLACWKIASLTLVWVSFSSKQPWLLWLGEHSRWMTYTSEVWNCFEMVTLMSVRASHHVKCQFVHPKLKCEEFHNHFPERAVYSHTAMCYAWVSEESDCYIPKCCFLFIALWHQTPKLWPHSCLFLPFV